MWRLAWLVLACVFVTFACAKQPPEWSSESYAAPAQSEAPPEEGLQDIELGFDGRPEGMPAQPKPGEEMNLAELIDIALGNNPATRYAWANARAAAAGWGSSRSEYYPTISGEVDGVLGRVRDPLFQGGRSYVATGLGLEYLLLDFGGREARVEAAKQALIAANWSHDQAIRDVLRDVPQAYYIYLGDKALVQAARENLRDAQTTLAATEARKESGVSTVADVLQARSSASQANADLAKSQGEANIARGTLATTVGWPANASFDIAREPSRLPVGEMVRDVNKLVDEAKSNRPDIGAAQAAVRQKEAEMKDAKTLPFPKLKAGGTLQYQRFRNSDSSSMYGGLRLEIPLFAGFSMRNQLKQAKAELEAARAQLTSSENAVIKEVWDAFHNFKTSAKQYKAFQQLLASARESYDVSLGRYKTGAADITELLNAQNTLASARAQLISARMELYSSYAELLHAVGRRAADRSDRIAYVQE